MELVQNFDLREQIILLVLFSFFSLIAIFGFKHAGFFVSLNKARLKNQVSFMNVLGAFGFFLLMQLVFFPVALGILLILKQPEKFQSNEWSSSILNVITIFVSFVAVLAYLFMQSEKTKSLLWNRHQSKNKKGQMISFCIGVCTWVLAYPIVFCLEQFLSLLIYLALGQTEGEQVAVQVLKNTRLYPVLYFSMIFCMGVLVPVMEEILFRGFLQTWFRGKVSLFPAIVLTSLVFSFFHFAPSQGLKNIEYITALFLLSLFLGYLYEREMTLWAPIGLHMSLNLISILMIHLI